VTAFVIFFLRVYFIWEKIALARPWSLHFILSHLHPHNEKSSSATGQVIQLV